MGTMPAPEDTTKLLEDLDSKYLANMSLENDKMYAYVLHLPWLLLGSQLA